MTDRNTQAIATAILYRQEDGSILVICEAAGFWATSPASPLTPGYESASKAFAYAGAKLDEHLARTLPVNKPPLALPDVSFDLEPTERP